MTFEVLTVSCYAGIASAMIQLGPDVLRFLCAKQDLPRVLDELEDVAIGCKDKQHIESLPLRLTA